MPIMRSGFARALCLGLILAAPALIEVASPGGPGWFFRVLAVDAVLLLGLSFALWQRWQLQLERQRPRRLSRVVPATRAVRTVRPAAATSATAPLAAV